MWAVDHPNSDDESFPARKLRLGSCITGGGVEGSRICSKRLECSSPARLAVYRLLTIVRRRSKGGGKRVPVEEQERESSVRREKIDVAVDDSPEAAVVSEDRFENSTLVCQRQDVSFNLAAGLGLLSLISASKTELDKTTELRREMEAFLTSMKEEHRSNSTTPKPSDLGIPCAAVSTTLDGLSNFSPYSLEDNVQCEDELIMDGLNHLEEELAAELDRLQVDSDTGELTDNQEFTEVRKFRINLAILCSETGTRSLTVSSGEVIDPQDEGTPEHCGIPPIELERRLHELLEARQDERIKELESHLECMKKKLEEKEVEVSWWKDTAKLISKQLPEPSRFPR